MLEMTIFYLEVRRNFLSVLHRMKQKRLFYFKTYLQVVKIEKLIIFAVVSPELYACNAVLVPTALVYSHSQSHTIINQHLSFKDYLGHLVGRVRRTHSDWKNRSSLQSNCSFKKKNPNNLLSFSKLNKQLKKVPLVREKKKTSLPPGACCCYLTVWSTRHWSPVKSRWLCCW